MDTGPGEERLELSTAITPGVEAAFDEAVTVLHGGAAERAYVTGLLERVRNCELFLFVLNRGDGMAGAVCGRAVDGEAELVFGFLRPPYPGLERAFLEKLVAELAGRGMRVVRSGFTWPGAGGFIAAATGIGFRSVCRVSMALNVADSDPFFPAAGTDLRPWSPDRFEDVSRIMYEESDQADRAVYPLFASPEGTLVLLRSVVRDHHGTFMPGLSAICEANGEVAGFLLATLLVDGSVLVLDIAVRRAYRRTGIGTRLLQNFIGKCMSTDRRQIMLVVTASNIAAIGLYKKMGFRETATFDQHVLILDDYRGQT